jgi:hypothetical protein
MYSKRFLQDFRMAFNIQYYISSLVSEKSLFKSEIIAIIIYSNNPLK